MVISYHESMWRKQHLGVSIVLAQFRGVGIILGFPAATPGEEMQDYIWCLSRTAINFQYMRGDFLTQT